MIVRLLQEAALPEELGYLVLIESSFLPPAVSPSGAAGLWQFVPGDGGEVRLGLTHVDECRIRKSRRERRRLT
jgi:membrane-bound lytic murein transglycosylase D